MCGGGGLRLFAYGEMVCVSISVGVIGEVAQFNGDHNDGYDA